jgi:hypothetical protein
MARVCGRVRTAPVRTTARRGGCVQALVPPRADQSSEMEAPSHPGRGVEGVAGRSPRDSGLSSIHAARDGHGCCPPVPPDARDDPRGSQRSLLSGLHRSAAPRLRPPAGSALAGSCLLSAPGDAFLETQRPCARSSSLSEVGSSSDQGRTPMRERGRGIRDVRYAIRPGLLSGTA